jgi:peptide/nickel transport system permease protein
MLRLVLRRLALAVPLVLVVSALTFLLTALTPGNLAYTILGTNATPASVAAVDHQLGLNLPIYTQYWHWLEHAVTGNLGISISNEQSVASQLTAQLPVTLSLVIGATVISSVLGITLGVLGAVRRGASGRMIDLLATVGFAIPTFWLGLVLVDLLALQAKIFPATGYVAFASSPSAWLKSLVLPWITLSAAGVTGIAKQTRDAMRTELGRDYVDMLRADGVAEWRIVWIHALRNASITVVTMIGIFFVGLLSGAVVVETVFGLPGLGSLAVNATTNHDQPVLQGIAVLFCLIVVVANLIVDLAYGWLNPKARVG